MTSNEKDITISVIVPIYNAEKYLVKCIDSIIKQTYPKLEIILIDDDSIDGSLKICQKYEEQDDRVIVIHKENGGLVAARKTGLKYAKGMYVTFVDADDYIDLNTYEILMHKLDSCKVDVVAFGLLEEYSDRIVKKENHYPSKVYHREQIEQYLFPSMLSYGEFFDFGILPNLVCKLVRREFWIDSSVEVDNCITVGEDATATFQLMANAQLVQLADITPYHYVKRNDSMMWKDIQDGAIESVQNDLARAFRRRGISELLEKQLEDYIIFISLLKQPKRISCLEEMFHEKRIALYGAGGFGQAIFANFGEQVSIWVDANSQRYRNEEFIVYPIEILWEQQAMYDVIFIAILNIDTCKRIKKDLMVCGIEKPILFYTK